MRTKGMIAKPKKLWLLNEFSLSVPKEMYRESMENKDTDVIAQSLLDLLS